MSEGQGGVTSRPVMDRLVGKIKETAGSWTGNDRLEHQGQLQQERTQAAETAEAKRRSAEKKEEEAEIVARQAALRAEEHRLDTEEAEMAERRRIERQKNAAQEQAEVEKSVRAAAINSQAADAYHRTEAEEIEAVQNRRRAEAQAGQLEQVADDIESSVEEER